MSTGEARKMLLMRWLLAPPRLWVRDEMAATLLTQACNPRC
jgi:ABC-type transport system involved in cytochrome bd biosynthesis fused ATPase/permease subunit